MRFIPAGAGNTVPAVQVRSRNSVYPRWRGEHADIRCASCCSPGLSPLARGTPSAPEHGRNITRFIPAGAGNTATDEETSQLMAVYPRWRGEHVFLCRIQNDRFGLSPLARGTPTPAKCSRGLITVYPRWRGEHADIFKNILIDSGLSPLARGTHCVQYSPRSALRFIPAGAGNTAVPVLRHCPRAVYPRWRGEHYFRDYGSARGCGLSPLARGTH